MAYDHSDVEETLGYSFTSDPTSMQVDVVCMTAKALLTAKVGTVDDSANEERHVLFLIVMRLLSTRAWFKGGLASSISTPAGSFTSNMPPVFWTADLVQEIKSVYGVDINTLPSAPATFNYNDGGLTYDR